MTGPLSVTRALSIPRDEITARASRAGGAGGQHVNTSNTRIEVVWCVRDSRALDDGQRSRLLSKLASRLDGAGCLRVVSSARRSQRQNRDAAEARLADLVRRALAVPRRRVATAPSRAAVEARLRAKRLQGERKRRRTTRDDD